MSDHSHCLPHSIHRAPTKTASTQALQIYHLPTGVFQAGAGFKESPDRQGLSEPESFNALVLLPCTDKGYRDKAAKTKCHRPGGLNNRHLLSHSSRSPGSRCQQCCFHSEASLLGLFLYMVFSLCSHMSVSKFPLLIRTPVIMN